jgi:MFS family permease
MALVLVSSAVTAHFLFGTLVVVNLPRLHRRFGVPRTIGGAALTAIGVLGWATAKEPWQLFAAALATGGGWVTMGAVAINALIATWYERARPVALAKAYNGASVGGVIFSPLWVALIAYSGFAGAAVIVGGVMILVATTLAYTVFAETPERLGQRPDGDAPGANAPRVTSPHARPLPGAKLWRDRRFLTLAAGMAAGLFAQIGLVAHLFNLFVPAMGAQNAGLTMGLATACAIALTVRVDVHDAPSAEVVTRTPRAIVLLAAASLSGLALLALEVIWFRFIVLFIFASSLAFALMLAVVAQVEFTARMFRG